MRDLPEGWFEVALGDVVEPKQTRNPSNDGSETFRYIDVKAVDNTRNKIVAVPEVESRSAPSRARRLVREGDVVFSLVRPYLRNIAVVPADLDGQVASTAFSVLRPNGAVESRFLLHQVLQVSFVDSVPTFGNSPPSAREEDFLSQRIVVAPVREQHRIVARVEALFAKLDEAIAALRRTQANLDRYRASVLKAAVEGRLTAQWRSENPPEESGKQLLERILAERRKRWEEDRLAEFAAKGRKAPNDWKSKYKEPVAPATSGLPELPEGWCWATVDQIGPRDGSGMTKGQVRSVKRLAGQVPLSSGRQRAEAAELRPGRRDQDHNGVSDEEIRPRTRCAPGDIMLLERKAATGTRLGRGCVNGAVKWPGCLPSESLSSGCRLFVQGGVCLSERWLLALAAISDGEPQWFFQKATQSVNFGARSPSDRPRSCELFLFRSAAAIENRRRWFVGSGRFALGTLGVLPEGTCNWRPSEFRVRRPPAVDSQERVRGPARPSGPGATSPRPSSSNASGMNAKRSAGRRRRAAARTVRPAGSRRRDGCLACAGGGSGTESAHASPRIRRRSSPATLPRIRAGCARFLGQGRSSDMIRETTYTGARQNLASLMDQVTDTREPVYIRRRGKEDVALIAASDLSSWMETAYLLRSPKNAERLRQCRCGDPSREGRGDDGRGASCAVRAHGRVTEVRHREAVFSSGFLRDLAFWTRTDRRQALRVLKLVDAVRRDPFVGVGKPEALRGDLAGRWSRRIDSEHRLVYRVGADQVYFLSARHHY